MARHSQPTKVKLLKGVDKKDPARINRNEPEAGALGNPPKHFNKQLTAIWNEVIANLADGVAQSSDRISLEIACTLLFEFRNNPLEFPTMKHGTLHTYLSKFGMTPCDRSKIVVPDKKPDNPFAIFD